MTGGSAAISEKVIKSRQMKAAKAALEADQKVTGQIEEKLQSLALNKNFAKSVAKDVAKSGGNLTISSLTLNSLLIKTAASGGFLTKGNFSKRCRKIRAKGPIVYFIEGRSSITH